MVRERYAAVALWAWHAFTTAWTVAFVAQWLKWAALYNTNRDALSWAIDFAAWAIPPVLLYVIGRSVFSAWSSIRTRRLGL